MYISKQVQCVNKQPQQNPHERIQNIGGIENGVRWKRTQPDAINDVERDANSYWVTDRASHSVWVIVRTSVVSHDNPLMISQIGS